MKAVQNKAQCSNYCRRSPGVPSVMLALAGVFGLWAPSGLAQPSFQGLGDLPGGFFYSVANGISGDGTTVAGWSVSALGDEAFGWTQASGIVGLGELAGVGVGQSGEAAAGGVPKFVGVFDLDGTMDEEAFLWVLGAGYTLLGTLPGGTGSGAYGMSADGSVVVGVSYSGTVSEAFRWTSGGGMVGLGDLPGGDVSSRAWDVSADGSVVVGETVSDAGGGSDVEAFVWTSGGGMVGLGDLAGGDFFSQARGVSADGTTVVGASRSASGEEAFRWTAGGGMVGLGDLPGGNFFSLAMDVSADGSVVVGRGGVFAGNRAFVWDEVNGMRNLQSILADDYGLDLSGWTLFGAVGISDDGLTIVGNGINPSFENEAWIARLAATGDGDFDADGDVDLADFRGFQNCLDQGLVTAACEPGDMQASGFVTIEDFELFFDAQTGPN